MGFTKHLGFVMQIYKINDFELYHDEKGYYKMVNGKIYRLPYVHKLQNLYSVLINSKLQYEPTIITKEKMV